MFYIFDDAKRYLLHLVLCFDLVVAVETTEGLSKNDGEGGEAVSYERRLQESSN